MGGFLIPWIAGIALQYFGWRYAMYIPGVLCFVMGFFLINRFRDTPESLGLPPIEKFKNDQGGKSAVHDDDTVKLTATRILIDYVFKNPFIWLLAISYFFVYAVREGVNHWTALFLVESKGYSSIGANLAFPYLKWEDFVEVWQPDGHRTNFLGEREGPSMFCSLLGCFCVSDSFGLSLRVYLYWTRSSCFLLDLRSLVPK